MQVPKQYWVDINCNQVAVIQQDVSALRKTTASMEIPCSFIIGTCNAGYLSHCASAFRKAIPLHALDMRRRAIVWFDGSMATTCRSPLDIKEQIIVQS